MRVVSSMMVLRTCSKLSITFVLWAKEDPPLTPAFADATAGRPPKRGIRSITPMHNNTTACPVASRIGAILSARLPARSARLLDGQAGGPDGQGKGAAVVEFAGANNPLYLIRNKNSKLLRFAQVGVNGGGTVFLEKINGDKFPIGRDQVNFERNFTNHTIKVGEGDTIYLFSDGYVDQFGGTRGKKFMAKRFQQLLIESQYLSMSEQEIKLNKTIRVSER